MIKLPRQTGYKGIYLNIIKAIDTQILIKIDNKVNRYSVKKS